MERSPRSAVSAAQTDWLPGRFTWHGVVHLQRTTARRVEHSQTGRASASVIAEPG
jgi:hypothetical protein